MFMLRIEEPSYVSSLRGVLYCAAASLFLLVGAALFAPSAPAMIAHAAAPALGGTFTPVVTPQPCGPGSSSAVSSYPIAIHGPAVTSLAGALYSFGGNVDSPQALAYRYTPGSGWTPIAPLPEARYEHAAVTDGTYIYILGGGSASARSTGTLWRYDPAGNTYAVLAPYTVPTSGHAAAYLDGKIYRISGLSSGSYVASVEVYTISTGMWTAAAGYPRPTNYFNAIAHGDYLYTAGGGRVASNKTYRYDPAANAWDDRAIADLPTTLGEAASALVGDRWMLAGGLVGSSHSSRVITWSPGAGAWTDLPALPEGRRRAGGASIAGDFYIVGGSVPGNGRTTDVIRYSEPACASATVSITLSATPTSTHQATSTPTRTVTNTASPTSTATPQPCAGGWTIPDSPSPDPYYNQLFGMDSTSPTDIWAVGTEGGNIPLIIHWDGTAWQRVEVPQPPLGAFLYDVDVISANDIWAVGRSYEDPTAGYKTLALHWNGVQWRVVPSPSPQQGGDNILFDVDALGPNDVWAVGFAGVQGAGNTLTAHWNGIEWRVVPNSAEGLLYGVSAVAPDDVWAVGHNYTQTVMLHWDGAAWTRTPSPQFEGTVQVYDAVALGTNEVWAAGMLAAAEGSETLLLRWDGSMWSRVDDGTGPGAGLFGIAPGWHAGEVWAVGFDLDTTLVLKWTGTAWERMASPSPGSLTNRLYAAAAVSPSEVWVAGRKNEPGQVFTLTERYTSGPCPTPSATPATGTPLPTATACPVRFADVPTSNTFYTNVRCLACQGIIGGYPCGGTGEPCNATNDPYFRPNNNITRGQIAKIVSESAGFTEPAGGQIYEDVPPASPFYLWINRLSNRGVMGGYLCGADPNEPCGPQNRPYFRPSANATRGQLAKIVSEAAGFDEEHTSQAFEDVPTTNTFYIWVERLVSRQIMGGYPCGGAGEPCGTENRPYFRWGNTVTRGQASKIVANTFFPGCDVRGR